VRGITSDSGIDHDLRHLLLVPMLLLLLLLLGEHLCLVSLLFRN
jgi:hypothetical protein